MWIYDKKLQFPVNIKSNDPRLAKFIISQYGGPDGELAASIRYLSQRFTMPEATSKAVLNDIGTEELAHLEIIGTICYQLTKNSSIQEIENAGFSPYYTDHGLDIYPASTAGIPFTASYIACKGDPIADLQENLAAEEKAKVTYENLIDLCRDNMDVVEPLRYLREREVVHFQRFGEALRKVQDKLDNRRMYLNNNCNI